jgi:hypothetical protein
VLVKKFFEIFFGDAGMNLIIHLQSYAQTIAFADAKTAGKGDLLLQAMLGNALLEQFNDFGRAL